MKRIITNLVWVIVVTATTGSSVSAQTNQVLEEVIATVGDNIVLMSELDREVAQMKQQYPSYEGDLHCDIFNQLVLQKMLLLKADLDSIVIADDRLDYEITRRLEFYAQQAGSVERLEQYLGMSILEYKDKMKDKVRDQMLAEQAREALLADVKVSPTEVKKFYDDIPADSIPTFSSEVEVAQIVVKPVPSAFAKEYAKKEAQKIRNEILAGDLDFCLAASIYSADKSNSEQCGSLGDFKRGSMVPEFETAAFKLKKDSISPVIETEYGFHIIQLVERRGEILNARHILIQPQILSSDYEAAKDSLKLAIELINSGKLTFCEAVNRFSEDQNSRSNCGYLMDQNAGSNKIEVTYLSPDVALKLEKMKPGEFSTIHGIQLANGSGAFRVLFLKSETPPHKADLKNDYQKLAVFALEKKKQDILKKWMKDFRKTIYVWIDEKYQYCDSNDNL